MQILPSTLLITLVGGESVVDRDEATDSFQADQGVISATTLVTCEEKCPTSNTYPTACDPENLPKETKVEQCKTDFFKLACRQTCCLITCKSSVVPVCGHNAVAPNGGCSCVPTQEGLNTEICEEGLFCSQGSPEQASLCVKRWRDDLRCGEKFPLADDTSPECNPNSEFHCCSPNGWCGYMS